ncbi:MAG: AAA family ATPase [Microthrixaceae bacterium]|nr:AAA family ATPase [Microthrixaceae bacterium]
MLIGRSAEIGTLSEIVESTAAGRAAFVVIVGEAGVGKSALLDFAAEALCAAEATVFRAFCDPLGNNRPFGPLLDALGAGSSVTGFLDRMRTTAPLGADRIGVLGAGVEIGSLLIEELVAAFEGLAVSGDTALLADDLHWADAPTVQTLIAVARRLVDLPLLIVVALRPDAAGAEVLESIHRQLGPRNPPTVIELRPLGRSDERSLATQRLRGTPSPRLSGLLGRCAGNPLLLTELITALEDDGCLRRHDGLVELTSAAEVDHLPATFADVVRARMARLEGDQREVAMMAALLGTRFTLDDLVAVTGRSAAELATVIVELVRSRVLTDVDGVLVFRHDLVREAIRDLVPDALAASLHSHIADVLRAGGASLHEVAGHVERGASPGSTEAMELLHLAAIEILPLDPGAAVSLLRRALAICPPTSSRIEDLTALLVEGLTWSGRPSEAHEVADELLARTTRRDVDERLRSAMARALLLLGRPQEAIEHATHLIETVGGSGRSTSWARAELAVCRLFGLDVAGAITEAELARRGALEDGDTMAAILGLSVEALARNALGQTAKAVGLGRRALCLADESEGLAGHLLHPSLFLGVALLTSGDPAGARALFGRGRDLGRDLGATWALPIYHFMFALAHWDVGEWDEMLAEVEAGCSFDGGSAPAIGQVWALAVAGRVHLHRGDLSRAAELLDDGDRLMEQFGLQFGADWLLQARVLLLEAEGRADEAIALAETLWAAYGELQASASLALLGPDLVRLAVSSGANELAERVVAVLASVVTEAGDDPTMLGRERRARGLFERNPELLVHSAELFAASGRELEAALARAEAGALLAEGRATNAACVLEEALAGLERLGAHAEGERVRALLGRVGSPRRGRPTGRRPRFGWEALTSTEWLVVREVAAGASNGEVAEVLGVSRRTIEAHLRSVYTKLGVSTRVRLALAYAEYEPG